MGRLERSKDPKWVSRFDEHPGKALVIASVPGVPFVTGHRNSPLGTGEYPMGSRLDENPAPHRLAVYDQMPTLACEEISVPTLAPLHVEQPHAAAVNQAGSQKVKSWWNKDSGGFASAIDALGLCVLLHFLFLGLQETAFDPATAAVNDESVSTSLAATEEGTGDGEEEFLLQGIGMIIYVCLGL